jgi:predicted DNA-binding transcriptional regulator YafY
MIFKQLNRLQQIDQLIRQRRTGNADELAQKLQLSRRQVYNLLEELKDIGLEIDYCREARTFIYQKQYKVNLNLDIRELTTEELISTIASGFGLKKSLLCNKIAHA